MDRIMPQARRSDDGKFKSPVEPVSELHRTAGPLCEARYWCEVAIFKG